LLLTALLGAALCVLLIACTNLANLLLARALMRRKELAVRAAMGAGRERLVRQMLTESVSLALIGGALGVLLAYLALPLLVRLVPVSLPIAEVPSIDLRVLLFAALVTCATGIGFGVVPALRISRDRDTSGLREGSRAGGGRRERLRSILVIAEVAGCVVLLVSSGLLIRALWRIQAVNPGFRAENVLTLQTSLPMPKYEELKTREPFYTHVLSEVSRLPGVTGAAYISFLPIVHGGGIWPVEVEGYPEDYALRQTASLRFISPGFFSVMGIPMLMGRDVGDLDTPDSLFVAVVSDSFVRKFWPGENPLGRRFDFGNHQRTVVGVVGNIRVRGLERSSEPQVYMPYRQHNENVSTWYAPKDLVVRASGNTAALAPALRRIIREADPQQPISSVRMFADIIEEQTAPRRVQASVLGAFALVAFLLAAIGIHGLLSFAVSNRTQEIGVRIALGAQRSDILGMVMRDGIVLAAIGIVVGVAFAYGAGLQLQSLLAGVHPGDAPTFLSAVVLCLVMTMAGSLIPALRAVRVDPTTAIRTE
jgi:putative ABC transport system permease protein